jgi:hypothetical protein
VIFIIIIFAMSLKHKNLFTVFLKDFYIAYLLRPLLKGHVKKENIGET